MSLLHRIEDLLKWVSREAPGQPQGLTSLPSLNALLAAPQPGVILISGDRQTGKTALALDIVQQALLQAKRALLVTRPQERARLKAIVGNDSFWMSTTVPRGMRLSVIVVDRDLSSEIVEEFQILFATGALDESLVVALGEDLHRFPCPKPVLFRGTLLGAPHSSRKTLVSSSVSTMSSCFNVGNNYKIEEVPPPPSRWDLLLAGDFR